MTAARQQTIARAIALTSLGVVVIVAGVLAADYAVARARLAPDEARLAQLQTQARTDAATARALQAERDAITGARAARRARIDVFAIVLIAASAAFIGSAKWRIAQGPRRPAPPPAPARKTVRLKKLAEALVRYRIDDRCTGCTLCAQACPTGAIAYRPYDLHAIDDARCTWCDKCVQACQDGAIEVVYTATGLPAPSPGRPRPFAR